MKADEWVLIDTCAWIDFLRSTQGALGDAVAACLAKNTAALCGVTIAELLHGAKSKAEQQKLEFLFAHVHKLAIVEADWPTAGRLLREQRAQGVALALSDALITVVAQRLNLPVLTADSDFDALTVRRFAF